MRKAAEKTGELRLKRVYQRPAAEDGTRILVDRLWPRGLSKAAARLDGWMKDSAPSPALRKWFDHRADRWDEFRRRYLAELASNPAALELGDLAQQGVVTLLYAAHDETHNHAIVLADYLGLHPAAPET